MGRGPRAALRLDALKQAFFSNLPQRELLAASGPQSALSLKSVAEASGFDVRKLASPTTQKIKPADERTQGRR